MTVPAVLDAAPLVGWASGSLGEVQAADREIARHTARRARAIAAFAATRPATADRQQGEPGAMSAERWAARPEVLSGVSEWAAHELSIALDLSPRRAEDELERSLTLTDRLPLVLDALEAGVLHPGHLWCLLEHVAPIPDAAVRARVQSELLDWMSARHRVTTPAQLGDRVRRVVARHNARDAVRDLARALRQRGVSARPDRCAGTSTVSALLTTPEAAALMAALGACADALPPEPGDSRTRGQKMADCLLDLVLRPGQNPPPPVQVALTVVAPVGALLGGDQPCEIEGQVVPAELVRALLSALTGRHPTGDDDTSPSGPDTEDSPAASGATVPPAGDGEPFDTAGGPVERAAEDLSAEAFDRWLDDLARRAFGDDPIPPPDPDPDPDGVPGAPPPTASGWWAAADRAVDDASEALLTLERALGHARRTVHTAERADTTDEAAWRESPAGRVDQATDALTALARAADRNRTTLADLPALRRADRSGTGLTAPADSPGYRPGAVLDRHVRARDRRCRFPGCRRPVPRNGELDHVRRWPEGPTAADNLAGFCTTHHRGKHQAPGWRYRLGPDGTLTVTTPSGLTAATQPPPY